LHPVLVSFTERGFYCAQGDFYIDPWKPVPRAVITHAHSDHSYRGHGHYLAHRVSGPVMRLRLGADISLETLEYGEKRYINGVELSLHPAGHIPGSAQVRLAYKDEIWVISGDYKTEDDGLCTPFEPVHCTHFVTESTFGLPLFRWRPQQEIFSEMQQWIGSLAAEGRNAFIHAYSLGKAQRLIRALHQAGIPILVHGSVRNTNKALLEAGLDIPDPPMVSAQQHIAPGTVIIAPASAAESNWTKRFEPYGEAAASGWMALRGTRRWMNAERGFALSDHADWDGLLSAVLATGAEKVFVTHGYAALFSRYLKEIHGLDAQVVRTNFTGESADMREDEAT
jgi:putative mRNA 3-end processing factor